MKISKINKKIAIPIYEQVCLFIEDDIKSGKIEPYSQLLPEPELSKKYGTSRITIRKVLSELERTGLVVRRKGKGTFSTGLKIPQKKDGDIAVLFFGLDSFSDNQFVMEILEGINSGIQGRWGVRIIMNWSEIANIPKIDQEFCGFIAMSPKLNSSEYLAKIKKNNIPLIFVSSYLPDKQASYVVTDNEAGTKLAVEHLIARGHSRIACISGQTIKTAALMRIKTFKEILKQHNISIPQEFIIHMDNSDQESGYKAAMKLLKSKKRHPTALFACTDPMAIGAMKAAKEIGYKIPRDLAIVGFDDIPFAAYADPALTTIRTNVREMGRTAVELLCEMITNRRVKKQVVMPVKLIVRAST